MGVDNVPEQNSQDDNMNYFDRSLLKADMTVSTGFMLLFTLQIGALFI